jgi:hypothetical protein
MPHAVSQIDSPFIHYRDCSTLPQKLPAPKEQTQPAMAKNTKSKKNTAIGRNDYRGICHQKNATTINKKRHYPSLPLLSISPEKTTLPNRPHIGHLFFSPH